MRLIFGHPSFRSGLLLLLFGLFLSGCSLLSQPQDVPDTVITPQLPPTPEPVPDDSGVAGPVQVPVYVPPEPDPEPVPPVEDPPKIAIVLSSRVPAYEEVAIELGALLEDFETYDLSDKSLTQKEAYDAIHSNGTEAVVAIGLRAVIFARSISGLPVVFSQVFNVDQTDLGADNIRGVAAIPPLDMQLDAWRELNPNLVTVGAIIGEGHDALIEEAIKTTEAHNLRLRYHVAKSDRETFYHFSRLAADIDGFWLFPDNRILSPTILKQMLDYASRHRVEVAVFNDSLLSLGAAISTTSVNADIAQTIESVLSSMINGDASTLPPVTPLSQIDVRTNQRPAAQIAGAGPEEPR